MKIVLTALAFVIASPALAQSADPHANHKVAPSAPAAPAHGGHDADKKGCCADKAKDCCKSMEGKGCCADRAKSGTDSHAGHQGH
jgi:hypothetical protein